MDREEALNELHSFIGQLTEGCQDAIRTLIPELRENEDEDENERIRKIITDCVFYQYGAGSEYTDVLAYLDELEKLKEQKPAEWSKEDEKIRKTLLDYYKKALDNYTCVEWLNGITYGELYDWLKSLRPQKLDVSKLENYDPVEVLNRIKTKWPMAWEKVVEGARVGQAEKSFCEENCKGYRDTGGKCFFGFNCSAKKEQEQAEVDLEKEIIRYRREDMDRDTTVGDVARHFYRFCKNAK